MKKPVFYNELQDHIGSFNKLADLAQPIEQAAELLTACIRRGGKILICGNGRSAADSQHFTTELIGRFLHERQSYPAIALTTDTSILTAVGNDYGFQAIFSRQIEALGQKGDSLIALSTSGVSNNILQAVSTARNQHMATIGLTGASGEDLASMADIAIMAPARISPRIQEIHIFILHYWVQYIEAALSPQ